jgi:monoamine oxidase
MADRVVDVAIVGGGVAGVYAGWRLRTSKPKKGSAKPDVALFETNSRIGGRLLSLTPPGMPHIRCELGGMRYESIHTMVAGLVEKVLKLKTEELPVGADENIAYLRGVRMRQKELSVAGGVPYKVAWAERGIDPGTLLAVYALDQILPRATKLKDLAMAVRDAFFDEHPLYEQGFWNLLRRVLSNEGYAFAMDASGYDSLMSNWNAADALPFLLADFAPGVKYLRLVNGYDEVPQQVAGLFQEAGGSVEMGRTLASFNSCVLEDGTKGIELRFREGKEKVRARSLILALPRRSLELLDPVGPLFGPANHKVGDLVRSVKPIPLFKLFMCYEYPWWEAAGVKQGRSITDLPLRQCYYWGVEGQQPNADPLNRRAALLGSYDDERYTTFWQGLRRGSHAPYASRLEGEAAESPGSESWGKYVASDAMVREAHQQLQELHGLEYAPKPYTAAYRDWQDDPFGGGVHFWRIGVKSWERLPKIIKPVRDVPAYICGEAYSHQQGWVEGALQTTELMLNTHFHLAPPDWLGT